MKVKIIVVFIYLFVACKTDKKSSNTVIDVEKKQIKKDDSFKKQETSIDKFDKFTMIFEGVFATDDLFLVFYTEKEGEQFSSLKTLEKIVYGSQESQKLIFTFPEGVNPVSFRIDFSDTKNQKEVKLIGLTFLDNYNKVKIDKTNLEGFFDFNRYMQFDRDNSILSGTVFKLNNKDAYNPYFISNEKFLKVMKQFIDASKKKKNASLINDFANINFSDGRYRVVIDGLFKKDDLVLLYYTEYTTDEFNIENSLSTEVKGGDSYQKIVFTLPKERYAVKVQLDISDRKSQSQVVIKEIKFIEGNRSFTISKRQLAKYFYANNYIDLDTITGNFVCKTIMENNIEKYNPYFVSTPFMVEKLLEF